MSYQSLYRKWRPQRFEDIVGQEHITKTLVNEIVTGHISHAYLFCGSRGTGKTTAAKVFAKAVNCENPVGGSPCNKCRTCMGIQDGTLMDVSEIDAASNNGVENIREISSDASYLPSGMKYKIYIVDEVHMLSASAFNALLKTLEEPPSHVIFILATTETHKIPATILSRCQRFDFKFVSDTAMLGRLRFIADQEGFDVSDSSLELIVRGARGGMRDAVSMLDQCGAYNNGVITEDIVRSVTGVLSSGVLLKIGDAVIEHNISEALRHVKSAIEGGFDATRLIDCLSMHFRNLVVAMGSLPEDKLIDEEDTAGIFEQSKKYGTAKAVKCLETMMNAYETAKWAQNPRLVLETALIRLAHPKADEDVSSLLARIDALEARLEKGDFVRNVSLPVIEMNDEKTEEPEEEEYVFEEAEPEEEYIPQEAPKAGVEAVFDCWEDIVAQIGKNGNVMLSMAVKNGEFRVKGDSVVIKGIVSYLRNDVSKKEICQAIRDISGADVKIEFADDEVKTEFEGNTDSDDPLSQLAGRLTGKINIVK